MWAKRITGSKIAPILGISPWESPAHIWAVMRGDLPPVETTDAMLRGTIQEDSILWWFFNQLRPDITQTSGEVTITRPDMPWAAANPDAAGVEDGATVYVEAKSVARDNGAWGTPGTDEIPLHYMVQVMWQMHMSHGPDGDKVRRCYVVKHGPYVDQYDYYVVDYSIVHALDITNRVKAFYDTLDDDTACPAPIELPDEHRTFARLHPDIERDLSWEISRDHAEAYVRARLDVKAAEARESKAKADILHAIGTARTATYQGLTIAYRRPTKKGVALYPPQRTITPEDLSTAATAA